MSRRRPPDILLVIADQLTPMALPFHGSWPTHAPEMTGLAQRGVVFDAACCNVPLCAPSRVVLMTGRLASRVGVYDNAAEFPAGIPTFAHALRLGGYRTVLAGKMHFCGPDQLHGFEERLTTDIYPADFGWTPDWDRPGERLEWYHGMGSVLEAGTCVRTNQLDYDDEVTFTAERKIYEIARDRSDDRPLMLTVSFTHPHDPFAITRPYWDLHDDASVPMPDPAPQATDPHSLRLRWMCGIDAAPPSPAQVRAARRAYMGSIAYVDAQLGSLRRALEVTGRDRDTVVVLLSDHGEMLGERGLWYKMNFFEPSIRVPLVVHAPGRFRPRRVPEAVSLADVAPTLLEIAGLPPMPGPLDGRSLMPHLEGATGGHDEVFAEYTAEGALAPIVMIRRGPWKFVHSPADPDQLFNLSGDPGELVNLARDPRLAPILDAMRREVEARWDLAALDRAVRESQRRRRFVFEAGRAGARRAAWDFQPYADASERYIRSHMPLDAIEAAARFPRP